MYQRYLLLFVLFYLSACGSSGSSSGDSVSPQVDFIHADVANMHPSYFEKWGLASQTIGFAVSVRVTDPQGLDNLDEIYVYNSSLDWYWALLDKNDGIGMEKCYYTTYQVFECKFYYDATPHSLPLSDWLIYIMDLDGNETAQAFTFELPAQKAYDDEGYIYSDSYTGPRTNGVNAIEVLTLSGSDLIFESNPNTQSFRIEFTTYDPLATKFGFVFYDGSAGIEYIAKAGWNLELFESYPLITGQTMVIDLPWSEISFKGLASAADINGLHIKLYDEPVAWLGSSDPEGPNWINHLSYSEYLTLND